MLTNSLKSYKIIVLKFISEYVKQNRKAPGLTQKEFAMRAGLLFCFVVQKKLQSDCSNYLKTGKTIVFVNPNAIKPRFGLFLAVFFGIFFYSLAKIFNN